MPSNVIANNKIGIIPKGSLIEFGILSSRVFTVWNKTVSGRLKSDINLSITITYNNFPFIEISDSERKSLVLLSQNIISIRDEYKENTLAELYDQVAMPANLRVAHQKLDSFVLGLYKLSSTASDSEILRCLFSNYEKQLTESRN
jgi:hypothetical protein